MPATPDTIRVADLSDDELVGWFRAIKDVNNGRQVSSAQPGLARAVEKEMKRRGLMPDREDLIPDESAPQPYLAGLIGDTDDLPPGPEAATGQHQEGEEIKG